MKTPIIRSRLLLLLILMSASFSLNSEAVLMKTRASSLPSHLHHELRREGGGSAVGNGGGTMVCRDPQTRAIRRIELLDFFEARKIRQIPIDLQEIPGNWKDKVRSAIHRLGRLSEMRLQLYTEWLRTFEDETLILKDVEFNKVADAMHIGVERGCEFEQAAVQIVPRLPGDRRYYLNDELWSAMDDTQKAGLVLHELIYREALSYGHTDSIMTRYFVSLVSSPRIQEMIPSEFVDTLDLLHFEMTDVELGDFHVGEDAPHIRRVFGEVETEFSPVNLWRSTLSDARQFDLFRIRLKGRMVTNVGYCRNAGCTSWESFRKWNYRHVLCSGAALMRLPGGETIKFSDARYDALDPGYRRCEHPEGLEISTTGPKDIMLHVESRSGSSMNRSRGLLLAHGTTHPLVAREASYWWEASESRLRLTSASTSLYMGKFPKNGLLAYIRDPAPKTCAMKIEFHPNRNISGLYIESGAESSSSCHAEVTATYRWNQDLSLHFQPQVGDYTIFFNEDESFRFTMPFIQSPMIKNILPLEGNPLPFRAWWVCNSSTERDFGCMHFRDGTDGEADGVPEAIGAFKGATHLYLDLDYSESGPPAHFECALEDGNYSLHPGTLVPRAITLRQTCQLLDHRNERVDYPAGAILMLNPQGKVTERIK